jgi:hypothetical protein
VVRKNRASLRAVSGVIGRRPRTILPMLVIGMPSDTANFLILMPRGLRTSSRKISPECTGAIFLGLRPRLVVIGDFNVIGVTVFLFAS